MLAGSVLVESFYRQAEMNDGAQHDSSQSSDAVTGIGSGNDTLRLAASCSS